MNSCSRSGWPVKICDTCPITSLMPFCSFWYVCKIFRNDRYFSGHRRGVTTTEGKCQFGAAFSILFGQKVYTGLVGEAVANTRHVGNGFCAVLPLCTADGGAGE